MRSNNPVRFLLKRNLFIGVIVFLLVFSILPFWGLSHISVSKENILKYSNPQTQTEALTNLVSSHVMTSPMNLETMVIFYGSLGFLCAVMLMRHLFSRRQGMLQASLPVKREIDFLRRCIAYAVLCVGPIALNFLFYLLVVGMNGLLGYVAWAELLPKFGMLLLINLYGFVMGTFSCVLTGTYWASLLAGAVLILGMDGMAMMWHYFAGQYLHTMVDQGFREVLKAVSPTVSLYKGFYQPEHFAWLPSIAAIVAVLGISYALYCVRRTEAAEHTLAFEWLHSLMGLVLPLIGGSMLGIIVQLSFQTEISLVAGMIIGAVLTFWVCRMVFNQRFCGILHQWYLPAAAAFVLVAGVAVLHTDAIGYDHYLPERRQLTSISYQPRYYHTDERITLTSEKALDAAFEWCTMMRDEVDGYSNGLNASLPGSSAVLVTYEVNGRKIYRQYANMTVRKAAQTVLKEVIESDDYRNSLIRESHLDGSSVENIYLSTRVDGLRNNEMYEQFGVFPDYINLNRKEDGPVMDEWIKALKEDIFSRTFEEKLEVEIFNLQINARNAENGAYIYHTMPVYPGDEHLLKAIFGDQAEKSIAYATGGYAASDDVVALKVTFSMNRAEMAAANIRERDVVRSVTQASGPAEAEKWVRNTRRNYADYYYYMPDEQETSFSRLYLYRLSDLERYQLEIPDDYTSFYENNEIPVTAVKQFIGE